MIELRWIHRPLPLPGPEWNSSGLPTTERVLQYRTCYVRAEYNNPMTMEHVKEMAWSAWQDVPEYLEPATSPSETARE